MPETHTLIFETSTPAASLVLAGQGDFLETRDFSSDRNHNAHLFTPLGELMAALDARGGEIGRVLVGSGPGSYSGTRVGIAAAQGVALAAGCPAVTVPSVLAVPSAAGGAVCLVIGDARRGAFWSCRVSGFSVEDGFPLGDEATLSAAVGKALAEGVPVVAFEDPARFPLAEELKAGVRLEYPTAPLLWRAWLGAGEDVRQAWSEEPPQPIYLKPPHITAAKRPWLVKP